MKTTRGLFSNRSRSRAMAVAIICLVAAGALLIGSTIVLHWGTSSFWLTFGTALSLTALCLVGAGGWFLLRKAYEIDLPPRHTRIEPILNHYGNVD